jgi:hypothetical protein
MLTWISRSVSKENKAGRESFLGNRDRLKSFCCAWFLNHISFTPQKLCPIASCTTGATEATAAMMVPGVVHDLSRQPKLWQVPETMSRPTQRTSRELQIRRSGRGHDPLECQQRPTPGARPLPNLQIIVRPRKLSSRLFDHPSRSASA